MFVLAFVVRPLGILVIHGLYLHLVVRNSFRILYEISIAHFCLLLSHK